MCCSLFLSILLSSLSTPSATDIMPVLEMCIALPVPDDGRRSTSTARGMAKMGTGRGLSKTGTGRGLQKNNTGRGFAKMGTGRGFAKMGTGRGLAKMGTGRGMAQISRSRGFARIGTRVQPLGGDSSNETQGAPSPRRVRGHLVDQSFIPASNTGADPNTDLSEISTDFHDFQEQPEKVIRFIEVQPVEGNERGINPAVQKEAAPVEAKSLEVVYLLDLQHFMEIGKEKLESKNYFEATSYFARAQQVEGFRGPASLTMAGARIAQDRYYEGINDLRNFLEGGGAITAEGIGLPQDDSLEKRLKDRLMRSPYDANTIAAYMLYALSHKDKTKASNLYKMLNKVEPGHPCLKGLDAAIKALP